MKEGSDNMVPILGISVWLIAKVLVLIALAIYLVFAVVVIRQISLMIETVEAGFETPIRLLGWGHFLFAVGIFVLALIIL